MPDQSLINDAIGFSFEVFEESWTSAEGPTIYDVRIMQRCLNLLGFPTGKNGQGCIDGVIGPNCRRALKQFQHENGMEITNHFTSEARKMIFSQAEELLAKQTEEVVRGCVGQLTRLDNQPIGTGRTAVLMYMQEGRKRVDDDLLPAFLAFVMAPHNGMTTPTIDLTGFEKRLDNGESPRNARINSLRFGFLQLPASVYEQTHGFSLEKAKICGDVAYHLDTIVHFLKTDDALAEAGRSDDIEVLCEKFPTVLVAGTAGRERMKRILVDIRACLEKK